jgi:hypothetical protein
MADINSHERRIQKRKAARDLSRKCRAVADALEFLSLKERPGVFRVSKLVWECTARAFIFRGVILCDEKEEPKLKQPWGRRDTLAVSLYIAPDRVKGHLVCEKLLPLPEIIKSQERPLLKACPAALKERVEGLRWEECFSDPKAPQELIANFHAFYDLAGTEASKFLCNDMGAIHSRNPGAFEPGVYLKRG